MNILKRLYEITRCFSERILGSILRIAQYAKGKTQGLNQLLCFSPRASYSDAQERLYWLMQRVPRYEIKTSFTEDGIARDFDAETFLARCAELEYLGGCEATYSCTFSTAANDKETDPTLACHLEQREQQRVGKVINVSERCLSKRLKNIRDTRAKTRAD